MVCNGHCSFWSKQERLAAEALAIHERIGLLDAATAIERRASLGTMSTISETALMLVLCGLRDEATRYFAALGELSVMCRREREYSGYRNAKDPVVEGDYATARGLELATWALARPDHSECMRALLTAHEAYVHTQAGALGPEADGRTALLLAQVESWPLISEGPSRLYRGNSRGKRLWSDIYRNVVELARAVEQGRTWPDAWESGFDALFQKVRDHEQLPEDWSPYHPDLDSRDVVGIARLRAKWAYGVADPWITMRSIRYPEIMQAADGGR